MGSKGVFVFMVVLAALFVALCEAIVTPPPPDTPVIAEGDSCSPPFGFLPLACEFGEQLNSTEEVLPADRYGVNVCRVTSLFLVNDTAYTYQKRCLHLFDSASRRFYQQCFLDCLPIREGNRCLNSTHMETRITMLCCPGTSPRKSDLVIDQEKEALLAVYHPLNRSPSGCPVAQGPTLLDCLRQQRLTEFIQVIMMANLTNFINSTAQNLSLFAPVNGMIPSNLSQAQAREFVLSHVVPQRWNGSQLVCGIRLESQTRHFLHVSSVEHVHRRRAVQSSYWQVVNPAFRENLLLKTERFVNGREIVQADACNPELFQRLHVVSAPIPVSNQSIYVLLQTFSNLSRFLQIINFLDLGSYLSLPHPNTLLAPSNVAFSRFSATVIECLQLRERRQLSNLVLYHLSDSVEFTTSLVNRNYLYTKLLQFLPVNMMNGSPVIGKEQASITVGDITAENGVLHVIDKLLLPPGFTLGSCESLTPAPPTTPAPTILPQPSSMHVASSITSDPSTATVSSTTALITSSPTIPPEGRAVGT